MLASSRGPCAAARFCGRDKSRPYELILCFRPNRNGRSPPGGRRAGCPHPAGPPAAANTPVLNRRGAAGVNARPTEPGKHGGQPGAPRRPPVGADSISARPASPQGPREGHAPPLQTMANVAVKRVGPHHPGSRAGCPHPAGPPAGAKTPGGYGIRPYDRRRAPRPTGKLRPCHTTNPCRGRCLHRPGGHASPQGFAGGINPAPTNKFCVSGQTGTPAPHRADVGRDALIPPDLPPPRTPRF